jgi:hypothetical protein
VYDDPCQWQETQPQPPIGLSVAELVAALGRQPGRSPTAPVSVSLDGYRGVRMQLSVPDDMDLSEFHWGEYRAWIDAHGSHRLPHSPGQVDDLWILDVDGERIVIDAFYVYVPGAPDALREELTQIVESIEFLPVPDPVSSPPS